MTIIENNPPHSWAMIEQSGQLPEGRTRLQAEAQYYLLLRDRAADKGAKLAAKDEEEAATQPKKRKRGAAATVGGARGRKPRPQKQRPGVAGGLGAAEGSEEEEEDPLSRNILPVQPLRSAATGQ